MDALVAGLVVAAVGGLAWVAYNHPSSFGTLATLCRIASLLAFAALLGHEAGALRTQNAALGAMTTLSAKVDIKSYDVIREAMKGVELPWWQFGVLGAAMLYLALLEALPRMGIVKER